MAKSPEFKKPDIITLRQRAGEMCSRCKKETRLPHSTPDKSITLGEAAHIRAARPGEARYVPSMTDEERGQISNGIWLCRICHKTIDSDEDHHTIEILEALTNRREPSIRDGE